jgi:hypothetical protein
MTLAELAGRLLKGSSHSQLRPGAGPYSLPRPSFERDHEQPYPPSGEVECSRFVLGGGMVSNSFGEHRAPSLHAPSWAKTRPLSDIRELTEPSLADTIPRRLLTDSGNIPRSTSRLDVSRKPSAASRCRPSIDTPHGEIREMDRKPSMESNGGRSIYRGRSSRSPSPPSPMDNHSVSSVYSIPPGSVPPRLSSRTRARSASQTQKAPAALSSSANTQRVPGSTVTHTIPIGDTTLHGSSRHIATQTFIRHPLSKELLEFPTHRHPRIELGLDLSAGIFVGGGSIEGTAQITIDDAERIRHRRTLDIARISIDLLGLEEMGGNRRCVFLNFATELIDEDHPPPQHMVYEQKPIGVNDLFWHLIPSVTKLPFSLNLPLNVGPPPFHSRNARIRYTLCASLLIRDRGKQYIVRTSEDVTVLSVYDRKYLLHDYKHNS